jgi:hypothetical protein
MQCIHATLRYIQFYLAVVQLDKTRIPLLALASLACDDTASLQQPGQHRSALTPSGS